MFHVGFARQAEVNEFGFMIGVEQDVAGLDVAVQQALTPPNLVVPEITQPTSDALVRTLAKNPADRFLSYDEFSMALETSRSQLLVKQYQNPQTAPKSKGLTSWWKRA